MRKTDFKYGLFKNKIPYCIRESGSPSIIIFEPSGELIKSLIHKTDTILKTYDTILPPGCSLCVLSYDNNLPAAHTHEQIAQNFAELLQKKYRPGIVIGISYGGEIAIPFAALYPDLTQKMILMVSAYAASQEGLLLIHEFIRLMGTGNYYKILQRFNTLYVHNYFRTAAHIITWLKRKALTTQVNSPSTFRNAYNYILQSNGQNKKYLPDIQAPALIIGGDRDQFFSKEIFEETAFLLPNGKAQVYKNEGHYVAIEKMHEVKKALNTFIGTGRS